jgi:hypothetical protein
VQPLVAEEPAQQKKSGKQRSGAERTRRYRERIDQGVQLVTLSVSASAVFTLARLRFLPNVEDVDAGKLRAAIADLMQWAAKQPR